MNVIASTASLTDGFDSLPAFVIVWDPEVLSEEDYADLVVRLGDLVRSCGGVGIERIASEAVTVVPDSDPIGAN